MSTWRLVGCASRPRSRRGAVALLWRMLRRESRQRPGYTEPTTAGSRDAATAVPFATVAYPRIARHAPRPCGPLLIRALLVD
jgi:hypothetical protein